MHRSTFVRLRRSAEATERHVWHLADLRLQRFARNLEALERRTKHTLDKCREILEEPLVILPLD